MGPVLVVLIVFVSFLATTKMIIGYKRSKMLSGSSPEGSFGTSQLEAMIERSVERAVNKAVNQTLAPIVTELKNLPSSSDSSESLLLEESNMVESEL